VIFFSDLDWGPKTGWENSTTKGAAVTIWGKNFGPSRGSSFVTVNGAELRSDLDYAEWGVSGPAKDMERITFWLNNLCQDGAGQITVTVNSVISNSLDFTVMDAEIYFVSVTDGDNGNNGQYATFVDGNNGPFKDIKMFNPALNPSGDNQYIVYVRGGAYTELDIHDKYVALKGPFGGPDRRKALIAYPGETPIMGSYSVIWNANYDPYGRNSYFTYSKLRIENGEGAIGLWGDHNRVVGCHFKDMLDEAWSGVIMVDNSRYSKIYGNLFENCGYDSYKHNIYVKSHRYNIAGSLDETCEYNYIGWNEFDSPVASDRHGGAIFLSTQSHAAENNHYTNHIWIHDNYFHDGNMDYLYTTDSYDVKNVYIYNNIFARGSSSIGGIVIQRRSIDFVFYNNVFYQIGGSGEPMVFIAYDPSNNPSNPIFINNIWHSLPGQAFIKLESGNQTFTSEHDLYYDPDGTTTPPSGSRITINDTVIGDPLFANPFGSDFHLLYGSPAIDMGTTLEEVTQDKDGIPRPQGSGYDAGCYEHKSGGSIIPGDINNDSNVNILDVQLCVNVSLGVEQEPLIIQRADMNGDGEVDSSDVQLLKMILLGYSP
jgi:hypothetical protein